MKLATYKDGSRDGQLLVVSKDLGTAHYATAIAHTLQQALDDWNFIAPQLQDLYSTLNQGKARHAFAFDPALCMPPLPRAHQWVQGNAYADKDLALTWGSSAAFVGAHDAVTYPGHEPQAKAAMGWAAITGDVASGVTAAQALEGVRLVALVNVWHLPESAQPTDEWVAFSPVAVTPDALGAAWTRGRVQVTLGTRSNGQPLSVVDAAAGMAHPMGEIIAAVAAVRPVRAGTVVGTGPIGLPNAEPVCAGPGERVAIEAKGTDGHSVWGAIDQGLASRADAQ